MADRKPLTVAALLELLAKQDPRAEVWHAGPDGETPISVAEVTPVGGGAVWLEGD